MTLGDRLFAAEADSFDLVFAYAVGDQALLGRISASLAEREVVFGAAAFVGVAADHDFDARTLGQEFAMGFDDRGVVLLDHVAVQVKVDAALGQRVGRVAQGCQVRGGQSGGSFGGRAGGVEGDDRLGAGRLDSARSGADSQECE